MDIPGGAWGGKQGTCMVWPGGAQGGPVIVRSGYSFMKGKRPCHRIILKDRFQKLRVVIVPDFCFEGLITVY